MISKTRFMGLNDTRRSTNTVCNESLTKAKLQETKSLHSLIRKEYSREKEADLTVNQRAESLYMCMHMCVCVYTCVFVCVCV